MFLKSFQSRWHLLALAFFIGLLLWAFIKIDQPAYTQPEGGETLSFTPFNDYLILMAGEHFNAGGYAKNYFLANMTEGYPEFARGWYAYQTPLTGVPNAAIYYTHYGSYDAMVLGLLLKMGITGLPDKYKIMTVLSLFALALWYILATRLYGNITAVISVFIMGSSLVFLRFIDNVSVYTYDILLSFGAALLFLWVEQQQNATGTRRNAAYIGVWLLEFFLMGNSPEFVPWLFIFFIGYLWAAYGKKVWRRWKTIVILITAPIAAQAIHFVQVAVALGGVNNAFIDFTAALTRRTTGFGLAEETGYRGYSIREAILKMNGDLWSTLHVEFIILAVLLIFSWWLTRQLKRFLPDSSGDRLWFQWKMLLVFFVGGIAFWFLMLQSTVTSAGSAYRSILPFIGLAAGYSSVNVFQYLRFHREPKALRAIALVLLIIIIAPILQDRLSGRPFQFKEHKQNPAMYYGVYPEEIKMLGSLLKEEVNYGDIVITDFRVAETGHPRYPFPGYEYYSGCRIEVARNVQQATDAINKLGEIRASLPAGNPASRVQFYLLFDEGCIGSDFDRFAQRVGELKTVFYEDDYWADVYGKVPIPAGSSLPFPPRVFTLYRVDADKFSEYKPGG
jgi:hypothetical protein